MPTLQSLPPELAARHSALVAALRTKVADGLIVAYSGGVDSAFLLWAAEQVRRETGGRLLALTAVSESLAQTEREDATRFSALVGVEQVCLRSGELENPDYRRNDSSRCYHCKTELFRLCRAFATKEGYHSVAYGYNASDSLDVRPGHRAAIENGILFPLAEAGLVKQDIRALMRNFGLPLADKPASPCLSSRVMQGVSVTPKKLQDIEQMEAIAREGGLKVFRVRLHEAGGARFLRLEVAPEEMANALAIRQPLVDAARARGYNWATLDLAGYRMGGASPQPPSL